MNPVEIVAVAALGMTVGYWVGRAGFFIFLWIVGED